MGQWDGGRLCSWPGSRPSIFSPHVEPKQISQEPDDSTAVEVHQVVHDLKGALLLDETVRHVFRIGGGKVKRFDIKSASQLSSIVHGT